MAVALITGTTGFLGGHLSQALQVTHSVVTLNRSAVGGAGSRRWDFRSRLPADIPDQVDVVVHCASPVGAEGETDQQACWEVNLQGTSRLLEYARRAKAACFVYVSSGAVYGCHREPAHENDTLTPQGVYGCAKAAAEFVVRAYQREFRTLCLRPFYPYGPGQRMSRLVPGLIERLRTGQVVLLNGPEGLPRVNPVYIEDVVAWATRLLLGDANGVFNLGGLEAVSIRELADHLAMLLGQDAKYQVRPSIDHNSLGDVSQVIAATGYQPQWTLTDGLRETVCATLGDG